DGIRDFHVTGVQTCALPISLATSPHQRPGARHNVTPPEGDAWHSNRYTLLTAHARRFSKRATPRALFPPPTSPCRPAANCCCVRSEERRVGKEGRSRWAQCQ